MQQGFVDELQVPTEGKQQDSASQVRVKHKWVSKRASYSESPEKFIIKPLCIEAVTWQLTSELVEASKLTMFCLIWLHFATHTLIPQPFLPPH